jgi:hypothetical protein
MCTKKKRLVKHLYFTSWPCSRGDRAPASGLEALALFVWRVSSVQDLIWAFRQMMWRPDL